jgi:hypothetical protein
MGVSQEPYHGDIPGSLSVASTENRDEIVSEAEFGLLGSVRVWRGHLENGGPFRRRNGV